MIITSETRGSSYQVFEIVGVHKIWIGERSRDEHDQEQAQDAEVFFHRSINKAENRTEVVTTESAEGLSCSASLPRNSVSSVLLLKSVLSD